MILRFSLILSLSFCCALLPVEAIEFKKGDTLLFYGDSFPLRLQEEGSFEAYLQASHPDLELKVRSFANTGDQVHWRLRPEDFTNHLKMLVQKWPADLVILSFGMNESFSGGAGLKEFSSNLSTLLESLIDRHPGAEFVFLSPIAAEDIGNPLLPDAGERNGEIRQYADAIEKFCAERDLVYMDLFTPTLGLYRETEQPLTIDGIRPNPEGARLAGKILAEKLSPETDLGKIEDDSAWFEALRSTVARKSSEVITAYRPTNGVHYYGRRGRDYEYDTEIPHHMELANLLDREIHRLASDPDADLSLDPLPQKAAEVPGGFRPPENGLGELKTTDQDLSDFIIADGFSVNLFASSEDFPELINPLQIAFDKRGRLWVATFSYYPIPVPGVEPDDKILIFEDTDGDGVADKRTVFADGLLLPDGFEFVEDGVVVSVPTKLLFMRDTDGDDKADVIEEMMRGFDDYDSHHGGFLSITPNGLISICEGVFHRAQVETPYGVEHVRDSTVLELNPRTRKLVPLQQPAPPNPWKVSHTNWGEGFQMFGGGQNTDMDYYSIWTPSGNRLGKNLGGMFKHGKGCTLAVVSSENFPDEWQGGVVSGHLLGRNTVVYTPLSIQQGRYLKDGDPEVLMNSSNQSFRPVDMVFGLDGALYVSDFYYPIIGHAQHSVRDENRDYSHGRIWRVVNRSKPLTKVPDIEGASTNELLQLLRHPQVRVRELVRNELGLKPRGEVLKLAADRVRGEAGETEESANQLAEIVWLYQRIGHEDMELLAKLANSEFEKARVAAIRALRYWGADHSDEARALLEKAMTDDSSRVRIVALGVITYLTQFDCDLTELMTELRPDDKTPLAAALEFAKLYDATPLEPVVPIFDIGGGLEVITWQESDGARVTWAFSESEREVLIGSRGSSLVNVDVNNLPVFRSEGGHPATGLQASIRLHKGHNEIRHFFPDNQKENRSGSLKVYLFDTRGRVPRGVRLPKNSRELNKWGKDYEAKFAPVGDDHIYLKAVPGKMVFNVNSLTVPAGRKIKFTFENSDEIVHNFVLVKPGAGEQVGALADQMAVSPDGLSKQYVPESAKVLFSTPLVEADSSVTLSFKTPSEPGTYPYLCTFPGHWRIMRGEMIVEYTASIGGKK